MCPVLLDQVTQLRNTFLQGKVNTFVGRCVAVAWPGRSCVGVAVDGFAVLTGKIAEMPF